MFFKKNHLSLRKIVAFFLCFAIIVSQLNKWYVNASPMTISENGIEFLKSVEGFSKYQYWDVSQYSIGYGSHTYNGEYPNGISEQQATVLLRNQVVQYESYVNNFINNYSLTLNQNQYDALVSFTYNLGNVWGGDFSLKRYLIEGIDKHTEDEIRTAFGNWCKAGGVENQGLKNRRAKEATLFLSGSPIIVDNHEVNNNYPKNIICYPLIVAGKVELMDRNHNKYSLTTRYIDYSDQCIIQEIYTDGCCKVKYPSSSSSSGYNTEYAKISEFINSNSTLYQWSPNETVNVYSKPDMKTVCGSVWKTDNCTVVSKMGDTIQIIYPVDSGGYKMGWVYESSNNNNGESSLPDVINIPGPVAKGIFDGKSLVTQSSKKIDFGNGEYISAGDICILSDINSSTGICTVEYPSGGSDVFVSGTKTKKKVVAVSEFVNYQPEFKMHKLNAYKSYTVYPTEAMTQNGTNWMLDEGDEYYTVAKGSNGATEVLYYCSRGAHMGYWKLGWIWLDYYSFGVSGMINGLPANNTQGAGIFDVTINNNKLLENGSSYNSSSNAYPEGSTYKISNVQTVSNWSFVGTLNGNLEGKITNNLVVSLKFEQSNVYCTRIVVEGEPTKKQYKAGEELDTSGLNVTAYYSDNTTKTVTNDCTLSGFTSTPGIKNIIVNYQGKTTAFTVIVEEKKLESISISKLPNKLNYYLNQKLDLTGMKVVAIYNNSETKTITDYDIYYDKYLLSETGKKTVTVSYSEEDIDVMCSFDITVSENNSMVKAGDINGDGAVNNKDLTRLSQYLSEWDVTVQEAALDVNGDGNVNNKDLTRLFQYLSGYDVQIFSSNDEIETYSFVYGKSVNNRDLVCYSIAPADYTKTILLEFEIHGFEDEYAHDGQVLVDTANRLVDYYSDVIDLNKTRLLIIPSSNPDGLLDGTTNNGFGRCNAEGIDLNRDFEANYVANNTPGRNYTPYAFSAKESRALRDLYYEYKPDIVIDFHGWESSLIGDNRLKTAFNEEMGLRISNSFTDTNAKGYFSNWAHQQGSLAMLVEFTSSNSVDFSKLINAINRLINDEY